MKQDIKNAKILVVDDQIANVEMIVTYLEIEGYTNIIATTDSREVMDLYINSNPDIILLDITMPYYTGLELMEMIKDENPENDYLPILILTADISTETKRKALQAGASDFLTKPFDLIELKARVNTHLQIRFKNNVINEYAFELKQQIAIKDKFFSIIAHDVRNPFTGIINYCRILLMQKKSYNADEVQHMLNIISNTASQGYILLENLLKWSKSQMGSLQIKPVSLNINKSINNSIIPIAEQAHNKGIEILNTTDSQCEITTDKEMFETIFRNLISNAVKFTQYNGRIRVDSEIKNDQIWISVADNGIGISDEEKDKLFRIDSKLQSRKGTADENGSGLGLILCHEFAIQLGGNIIVESTENIGTTFTLHLPLQLD